MSEEDRKWLEQLIRENKELKLDRKHLLDLQKNMDKQYEELQQKNQQLKQKYEMQKDSNKLLCKAITCDDCDCKVCEAHKQNIKYKSVLDEIREYIECSKEHKLEHDGSHTYLTQYAVNDLLQILDKVKE